MNRKSLNTFCGANTKLFSLAVVLGHTREGNGDNKNSMESISMHETPPNRMGST